ncbi:hypothetical protein, partial [Salmonella enterica]
LILSLPGLRHGPSARVFFPKAFLTQLAAPGTRAMPLASALVHDDETLTLSRIPDLGAFDRVETVQTDLGLGGLALRTSIRSAPITSSFLVALMLPLLMWAAAAGLSWFIVDRLLIRPLRVLRASVAAYTPGEVI